MVRLSIRMATACDVPAMAHVHVAAVRSLCRTHYQAHELSRWISQGPGLYSELVQSSTVMVAELDGEVVGFAGASLAHGYVRAVYVAPGAAGSGVGMRLLVRLERVARVFGLQQLTVDATLNAAGFYERAGYRKRERRTTGLGLGCIRMVKLLRVANPPARAGGGGAVDSGPRARLR